MTMKRIPLVDLMLARARGRFCPRCKEAVAPLDPAWGFDRGRWVHACTINTLERRTARRIAAGGCHGGCHG